MKKEKLLYIHIPFCAKKCLFCSFAVSVGQAHRVENYLDALEIESKPYQASSIATIYLGGGTPSFLTGIQMTRLVAMIKNNFNVNKNASWSIEVNPEGVDVEGARLIKRLGFNRISMGVQSFNDAYLKFLGRGHDATLARKTYGILREAGFNNINIDLMYGFPGQTKEQLQEDLNEVIALNSEHVSIYTLTIEPNSRFYAKQMKLDSDEKLAEDYVIVADALEQAGLKQYEVSNFSKPGFESQHNKGYWQGVEYIGLGMGAHSFLDGNRSWNVDKLNPYIEKINAQGQAVDDREVLSKKTLLHERLIFGLRMNQGIDLCELEDEFQMAFGREIQEEIKMLINQGFLSAERNKIKTTLKGRLVLDEIATRLI